MTRDDWRQMLRELPVAVLGLVALYAFMAMVFAVLGPVEVGR